MLILQSHSTSHMSGSLLRSPVRICKRASSFLPTHDGVSQLGSSTESGLKGSLDIHKGSPMLMLVRNLLTRLKNIRVVVVVVRVILKAIVGAVKNPPYV